MDDPAGFTRPAEHAENRDVTDMVARGAARLAFGLGIRTTPD
jgi:hypothetical protein